jgi:hypothetical protein
MRSRKGPAGSRGSALSLDDRVARLKQAARDADAKALAEGRMTPQQINRKNSIFDRFDFPLDLASGGRLRRAGSRKK